MQRLLRLMSRWTDRINAEADKNPGVFEEARTQLERVVKPLLNERAARVFRLQEMCEGRQSAEVVKQRILRELLARLDERPVPNAVIELLNGGWRNVLLMAEMRHGVDSDEAREAWQVLQQLCAWLDPDQAEPPSRRRNPDPAAAHRPGAHPGVRRQVCPGPHRRPARHRTVRRQTNRSTRTPRSPPASTMPPANR